MAELEFEKLSMDPAAQELIKKAQAEGLRPFGTGPRP